MAVIWQDKLRQPTMCSTYSFLLKKQLEKIKLQFIASVVNHFHGMSDSIFFFCVISKSDQRIVFITMIPV